MLVRSLLLDRYAPLHMLCDRTVGLYMHTLDRFRDYLATVPGRVDPEPTLDDLDDLVVSKFLRYREITPHRGKIAARNSVLKDRTQLVAIWTYASKKKLLTSTGQHVEWPSLPPYRAIERVPRAYSAEDVAKLIRLARTRSDFVWASASQNCALVPERTATACSHSVCLIREPSKVVVKERPTSRRRSRKR